MTTRKSCANKFENLDETDLFLEDPTNRIIQKETDNTTSLTKELNLY